jgi:oligosaccharide repeat unit polymerase
MLMISWIGSKNDVLSPSVLINAAMILGVTFYMFGVNRLKPEEFSLITTFIIVTAIAFFMFVEFTTKFFIIQTTSKYINVSYNAFNKNSLRMFAIPKSFMVLSFILIIVCTVIQFLYIKSYVGGDSLFSAMSTYRNLQNTEGAETNLIVNILSRIVYALIPIYIFCFFYNIIVVGEKPKHKLVGLCVVLISTACIYLITMARGKLFSIAFQIMAAITICANYRFNIRTSTFRKKTSGNRLWLRIALIVLVLGIPTFYLGGILSGKNYSQITPLQSVENYFSYGLIRLNHIVINGYEKSKYFGQWSFSGVYSLLNKLGAKYPDYNIFPYFKNYGNTLTLFGRWYVDFGYLGVLVMSALMSLFFTVLYIKMKHSKSPYTAFKYSVVYIFFISTLLMACYDDWFRNTFSINCLFQIVVIVLICKWLYNRHYICVNIM